MLPLCHALSLSTFIRIPASSQLVIWSILKTLSPFDEDHRIPVYSMRQADLVPFVADEYCQDLEHVLSSYGTIASSQQLHGQSEYAPIVQKACELARQAGSFHLLLVIADREVSLRRVVCSPPHITSPVC